MVLDKINNSCDIKKLNNEELLRLSNEIRQRIIEVAKKNGGHLSSNLGIIETTIALNYVFDFPKDKIVFDVGHQCYAYKILTGRKDKFSTIRTDGGLSGFLDKDESEYDTFTTGHAGNSLALSVGLANARDKVGEDYYVVDVVGDGSFINGLNLEALTSSASKPKKMIIILNDNGMSISPNRNGLYNYISKRTLSAGYVGGKNVIRKIFGNSFFTKFLIKVRNFFRRIINKNINYGEFGVKYVGNVDGNNLLQMIKILEKVKNVSSNKAILLHVKTTKGKGHVEAENHADLYHGVGKNFDTCSSGFGVTLGEKLNSLIEKDDKIVAITAGMKDGTGLETVSKLHPKNFIDVGITEEYAVSYSAGLCKGGLKPIVCIYSTFLQRGYDQIIHDVCMQNLPVIFCLDRAGLVGQDGKSHQGAFDLSYLSHIPNMTIICPNTESELCNALDYALTLNSPVAIRYPKTCSKIDIDEFSLTDGYYQEITSGKNVTVLAVGSRMLKLAHEFAELYNKSTQIISVKVVKPLSDRLFDMVKADTVVTLEENSLIGGFGSLVSSYCAKNGKAKVLNFGLKDEFINHGEVETQMNDNGLTAQNILNKVKER